MKPPRCAICDRNLRRNPDVDFDLVSFKLTEEQELYNQEMRASKKVGHPRGRTWFCQYHLEAAKANNHLLLSEAIELIKGVG